MSAMFVLPFLDITSAMTTTAQIFNHQFSSVVLTDFRLDEFYLVQYIYL
jgi:hypothetical protein